MSKKPKVGMWSGLTAVTAVLTAGAIVGTTVAFHYTTTVNNYLDADTYKIIKGDSDEDTEYFKSDFTSDEERESYEAELCAQVEARQQRPAPGKRRKGQPVRPRLRGPDVRRHRFRLR